MKILVVGSGGREHALAWKIAASPRVEKVYAAPGNAGMCSVAECLPIRSDDIDAVVKFAVDNGIGLVVVGPEVPLVGGMVDALSLAGIKAFGPTAKAAVLEGSKIFAKEIMTKCGVPTAAYRSFDQPEEAAAWVELVGAPLVIKADGLAAGKGVIIARTSADAHRAIDDILIKSVFGSAGRRLLVEEMLDGEEASLMAFCDGENVVLMDAAQDYKRVSDGDAGPNTGGMGCYSPVAPVTPLIREMALENVFRPVIAEMASMGVPFKGVLYAGLMLTADGPMVLEFNVRFGDPETQVILPRMEGDLVDVMEACVDGRLDQVELKWSERKAVSVVMASGGYPAAYSTGYPITGLEDAAKLDDVVVFHAGTAMADGSIVTAGGRVLNVTALGDSFCGATARAYEAVNAISFKDAHWRSDIAKRAIDREVTDER
ncbi:MAG: phosphoribosylamine--glycine ligase [bacterium]|nr:phosphoribosylamine--glycine ligase [bacterium]